MKAVCEKEFLEALVATQGLTSGLRLRYHLTETLMTHVLYYLPVDPKHFSYMDDEIARLRAMGFDA